MINMYLYYIHTYMIYDTLIYIYIYLKKIYI